MIVDYVLIGLVLCITIVGIPFGKQFFKIRILDGFIDIYSHGMPL